MFEEASIYSKLLKKVNLNRERKHVLLDESIYYLLLFIALIVNFALAVNLIFLFVILPGVWIYGLLFVCALAFGALFERLLADISVIEDAKVFHPALFLGAIGVINTVIVSVLANDVAVEMGFSAGIHSNVMVATVYVFGFLIPHFLKVVNRYYRVI